MLTDTKLLSPQDKIKDYVSLAPLLENYKKKQKIIVQCHGVFDLLHPGHIRHFKLAKKQGDVLVVTITPDRYVNKGPGRPVFNEQLRLESVASLDYVDFVVLNDSPDAVTAIKRIQPNVYVKGKEYEDSNKDVTQKIQLEKFAVESCQGTIYFTDDIVFSSSSLLNRFFDPYPKGVQKFLKKIKEKYSLENLVGMIEAFSKAKVLVIGDAIIDIYQYVNPLGQSGKGQHLAAVCYNQEVFLGGALIIANHLAEFTPNVKLVSALGYNCPHYDFIHKKLHPQVDTYFISSKVAQTLTKKRYVLKDGEVLSKLFETYSTNSALLDQKAEDRIKDTILKQAKECDLVLVCDFGNGLIPPSLMDHLSSLPNFISVNTQINSGNRGYHVVTQYARANYVSLNEPEARLAIHDRFSPVNEIAQALLKKIPFEFLSITRGVNGVFSYSALSSVGVEIPALNMHAIDRVGAGDSFFALSSLAAQKKAPIELIGLFGSIAAALDVQIIGNREPVRKSSYLKYLTRLMK